MKKVFNVNEWGASWLQTYVELEPGVDLEQLNEKLKGLAFRKAGPACESIQIFLYPLNKMLLYGQFKDGIETGGGYIKTVSLFFLIGVLILLIALSLTHISVPASLSGNAAARLSRPPDSGRHP